MILRPAGPADAGQVADVDLAARLTALPNVRWAHSPEEIRQWIAETLIPSGGVHVADSGGRLLGYIALRESWVDQLYVQPPHWHRGIGSALLRLAKDRFPHGLTLYCFQCNLPARMFYERNGFIAVALSNGEANQEREPDILYSWPGEAAVPQRF